ncbi:hypothetical protein [Roseobacter sp. N2S]|uniref:hypothetical protein n=1 Tax=Roseobacter sp. N2S TaxID=2663844 RepID=UPI002857CA43|nr:hypothetical protein [Roseobacter sp. N2S]MDR6267574.1 hypothetical protein [Roseobacter sp. N2S]
MHPTQKTFMVWPPLKQDDYGGAIGAKSYFSWFFGHCCDKIMIPVEKGYITQTITDHVSVASLWDSGKVNFVEASEDFTSVDIVLVRTSDISKRPVPVATKKLLGSNPVKTGATDKKATAQHYFIGTPEDHLQDAYFCVCFSYWYFGGEDAAFLERSRQRLISERDQKSLGGKISVFGTGPSINEALRMDFNDSYSIVCNTIVKNRAFLNRMNLGLIVATDAHFHFSSHRYSARLLSDTLWALHRHDALFVTFDKFAAFLRRRVPEFEPYICGIPAGRKEFGFNLDEDYRVFPGESVLNMFLLPLAMFMGSEVDLCGFTGRSSTDKYFWGHSDVHQYADLMQDVRSAHPAFFADRDFQNYGDIVDQQVTERVMLSRAQGKTVRARTTSFYRCFQA